MSFSPNINKIFYNLVILEVWFLTKVNRSTTCLPFNLTNTTIINANAAKPSKTGTNIIIHVGVPTQFDSISQKGTSANKRQHPSRHASFCAILHYDILNIYIIEYIYACICIWILNIYLLLIY